MLGSQESHIVKEYCAIKVEILRSSPTGESIRMKFVTMLNSYQRHKKLRSKPMNRKIKTIIYLLILCNVLFLQSTIAQSHDE